MVPQASSSSTPGAGSPPLPLCLLWATFLAIGDGDDEEADTDAVLELADVNVDADAAGESVADWAAALACRSFCFLMKCFLSVCTHSQNTQINCESASA